MDIQLIRQLWSVVQSESEKGLAQLDDISLVQSLLGMMQEDPGFDPGNLPVMNRYIHARLPLIRDMASQV